MKTSLKWEYIDELHLRAAIPDGWLVKSYAYFQDSNIYHVAMCFVPDPEHKWSLNGDK